MRAPEELITAYTIHSASQGGWYGALSRGVLVHGVSYVLLIEFTSTQRRRKEGCYSVIGKDVRMHGGTCVLLVEYTTHSANQVCRSIWVDKKGEADGVSSRDLFVCGDAVCNMHVSSHPCMSPARCPRAKLMEKAQPCSTCGQILEGRVGHQARASGTEGVVHNACSAHAFSGQ
eukprot:1159122-Pelagomonas_calceolata.AAC.9